MKIGLGTTVRLFHLDLERGPVPFIGFLDMRISPWYQFRTWAADITYLPMARGFLYLVAVMDWHSRYVVAWRLSNILEASFCAEALGQGQPTGGVHLKLMVTAGENAVTPRPGALLM